MYVQCYMHGTNRCWHSINQHIFSMTVALWHEERFILDPDKATESLCSTLCVIFSSVPTQTSIHHRTLEAKNALKNTHLKASIRDSNIETGERLLTCFTKGVFTWNELITAIQLGKL